MTAPSLDHIIIAAASLDQGAEYIQQALGVEIGAGGEHDAMGTHNRLMRLGEGVYLEVLAVNPQASAPDRPRWFGLDEPGLRAELAASPRLLTWVVRTDDLAGLQERAAEPLGRAHEMSRGDFRWRITVPDDGSLPCGGLVPTAIQWLSGGHPTESMADSGCSLARLELHHPQADWLKEVLASMGVQGLVEVEELGKGEEPRLSARGMTQGGERWLG